MIGIIRSLLQAHLTKLGAFNTAWEGVNNAPELPYQVPWLTISTASTASISDRPRAVETGFLQITLYYASGRGTKEIEDRAALIRRHFYGQSLIKDSVQVVIHSPPTTGGIFLNDDKLALPITINFTAYEL
ncbi:hypothetical protein FHQ28_05650 [Pasteurellaceae bacterium USgator11]|nr:hypothetical protein FHQ20_07910 [Pasteurellaceae bacterium USgator41]TNG96480.1 hypothetical protein FHQ19_02085 [Pasteurellaceae bacterium UScroc12]TNH00438.1 hypothetical protein FHQ24_03540 [Pasteurellaceae bacterium UScroc31]TNH01731.1 hypothetical protein FHQ28_05650 [Pasteurellaceae bacterium USgator11]